MTSSKQERIAKAREAAAERRRKAVGSLRICFIRAEVMRRHHDALLHDALDQGRGADYVADSDVKKARFITYVSYWFAALSAVIERYQELSGKSSIPSYAPLDALLTTDKINLVKPFRNAIAHCSEHDDQRVLALLENAATVPDWAADVATTFRAYLEMYDMPPGTEPPGAAAQPSA